MRKIIHVDMDCFYAAVEMRDNPDLRQHPIAVGGQPGQRSVLCTCNYLARGYGVHSAMPSARALQLCPELKIIQPNMEKYRNVSIEIRQIFEQYTDKVEPLSLDEAYLDVSNSEHNNGSATWIAQAILAQIYQTQQLTASAGVAPNKFLAKVASDWRKPNGLFVVRPEQVDAFVSELAVEQLIGVGKVTAAKLHQLNIRNCGDLQAFGLAPLVQKFGAFGVRLHELSRGHDAREVRPNRQRKSLSVEHTYLHDLPNLESCLQAIDTLFVTLTERLKAKGIEDIHKQFIKMKFFDFEQTTVESISTLLSKDIYVDLMTKAYYRGHKAVRLLGLGVGLDGAETNSQQLKLPLASDD